MKTKTKSYRIEIVINGVVVIFKTIQNKPGIEDELFFVCYNFAGQLRKIENLSELIDDMINKGTKRPSKTKNK